MWYAVSDLLYGDGRLIVVYVWHVSEAVFADSLSGAVSSWAYCFTTEAPTKEAAISKITERLFLSGWFSISEKQIIETALYSREPRILGHEAVIFKAGIVER